LINTMWNLSIRSSVAAMAPLRLLYRLVTRGTVFYN